MAGSLIDTGTPGGRPIGDHGEHEEPQHRPKRNEASKRLRA